LVFLLGWAQRFASLLHLAQSDISEGNEHGFKLLQEDGSRKENLLLLTSSEDPHIPLTDVDAAMKLFLKLALDSEENAFFARCAFPFERKGQPVLQEGWKKRDIF